MREQQGKILGLLREEFARARSKNPSYSLRSYSRRLKISVSALSGIMNGKLPVTRKSGEKILRALYIDPQQSAAFLQDLRYRRDRPSASPASETAFNLLDMEQFHLISEWHYFGILSLATTQEFKSDVAWIAGRLGIAQHKVKSALERLERLGLLLKKGKEWVATGKQFKTSSGVPNTALRRHHAESLDLARRAMEEDPFDGCDFSSITMAIDPADLPAAKKKIQEFRASLCQELESGDRREVYRMSIQIFPLSGRKGLGRETT